MKAPLQFHRIFPIDDEASARFMLVKADCLHSAGVVDDGDRRDVMALAARYLPERQPMRAA